MFTDVLANCIATPPKDYAPVKTKLVISSSSARFLVITTDDNISVVEQEGRLENFGGVQAAHVNMPTGPGLLIVLVP